MRVAIHQPNFMPWLGFFHKAASADVLVLLDDVQFIKRGYIQRNYVKSPEGRLLLGVPVVTKGRYEQTIAETQISDDPRWRTKMVATLKRLYGRAPGFAERFPAIEAVLVQPWENLSLLNQALLECLLPMFGIATPLLRSSDLENVTGTSTERLISICQAVTGTEYLSGSGGKNYQDESLFAEAGIELSYLDFEHPTYDQLYSNFEPNLSAIDYLLNVEQVDLFHQFSHAA